MPQYDVIVTADVTESAVIRVEADSIEEANEKALDEARLNGPSYAWERDDGNPSWKPYLGDPDGAELVVDDSPPVPKPPVPYSKVKELADNIQTFMRLQQEKQKTVAILVGECVRRIEAASTGHWDIEDQRKAKRDREEAIKALKQLVTQLEINS